MPTNSPTSFSAPATDVKLYCLSCGYNLTGLVSPRCPECGTIVPREILGGRPAVREQPATPWEHIGGVAGFVQTFFLSLFAPRRLIMTFPAFHNRSRAEDYSLICYSIGFVLLVVGCVFSPIGNAAVMISAAIGLLFSIRIADWMVARWLEHQLTTLNVEDTRHFWRGVLHYQSAFVLLFCAGLGGVLVKWDDIVVAYDMLLDDRTTLDPDEIPAVTAVVVFSLSPLIAYAWWWLALVSMIFRRARRNEGAVIACLCLPAIAFVAILLSVILAALAYVVFGVALSFLSA